MNLNPAKMKRCMRPFDVLPGLRAEESYEYLNSITPQPGSVVRTPDGEGTVLEANVVAGTLKVRSNVDKPSRKSINGASVPTCAGAAAHRLSRTLTIP